MANTKNTKLVLNELMFQLNNSLVAAKAVERKYEKEFKGDAKQGDTIHVKLPQYYTATQGTTMNVQNINEHTVPITLDQRWHVAVDYSMDELLLNLKDPDKELFKSIVRPLAVQLDKSILEAIAVGAYNYSGTPGTAVNSYDTVAAMQELMTNTGVPIYDRKLILNPNAIRNMSSALKGLFMSETVKKIVGDAYRGDIAGFNVMESASLFRDTASLCLSGSTAVFGSATGTLGNTFVISGLTNGYVLKKGSKFTISGVNGVNIDNKMDTGSLQQFTVLATTTSAASAAVTVQVAPNIILSGAYQTVTAAPANGASISFMSTSSSASIVHNVALVKQACAVVSVPLKIPKSAAFAEMANYNGISIRCVADWDQVHDRESIRFDSLWGVKLVRPELAGVIYGT